MRENSLGRLKIFAADLLRIAALAAIVLFLMEQFKGSRISEASFDTVASAVIAASGLPSADAVAEQPAEQSADAATESTDQSAVENETAEVAAEQIVPQAPAQPGDNQMIKRLYGLDPEAYDGILLYYPTTNMNAEELLLVKLKGSTLDAVKEQQEIVKTAMETRRQTQMHTFEGYAPQQYATLEPSVIDVQGNYLLFVSGNFAPQTQAAFEESITQ